MNRCGIYEIFNTVSGRRYVGSAKNLDLRWYHHRYALERGKHHSFVLQRAWNKHGSAAFLFQIVEECEAPLLVVREQFYIETLRPQYNIARRAGGGGGPMSEATRANVAASNTRRTGWHMSEEAKRKIAVAHLGNTATKGKKRDPVAAERTAAAHRGMKRSPETCARISAALKGKKRKPYSAETRAKLSAAMKARPHNPERVAKMAATKRGSRLTPEHRAKIGEASRRMWAAKKAAFTQQG